MKDNKKEIIKEKETNKETSLKNNDSKKNQIFAFVAGLLVGAIITTGVFLVIRTKDRPRNMPNFDPSTFENGNFDKSKMPSRDGSNRRQRQNDSTKSDTTVESGE